MPEGSASLAAFVFVEGGSAPGPRIRIVRRSKDFIDEDNCDGGRKYLVDALRYLKVLRSDDFGELLSEIVQEKPDTNRLSATFGEGTLIEIEF